MSAPAHQPSEAPLKYAILRINRDSPDLITDLAQKYRALRLYALQTSPEAYGSTHTQEAAWPLSTWTSRLSRPNFEHIIAVAHLPNGSEEWVGQVTLRGPIPLQDYDLPPDAEQPVGPDEEETRWHMTALYTADKYRGKGVAGMVCQAAFEFAREYDRGKRARIRLMVKPDNVVARRFYGPMGFEDAGRVTFLEAVRANGDEWLVESVREEYGEKFVNSRMGSIMAVVL